MRLGWRDRLATIAVTALLTSCLWVLIGAWVWERYVPGAARPSVMAVPPAAAPVQVRGLLIPVPGVAADKLEDTFTQARAAGRHHDAIDIMAPRGTPVRAATAGTVEKLFLSKDGGNTIYVRSPDRRTMYYYAHLDRYASGLGEQQQVRQGQVIGYVGSTGDANPAAPHLHFAINLMRPEDGWWQGQPIDPYPLLGGR
ncbi:MAG: M23 family metallopeptidase [Novosphingobium sp.]|nr:M23 family metallopeptidase [Novosphingobium sp.]